MYISTFTPLQSALSGINAAQEELETSSDNIANASTPGYTDESANLGENLPLTIAADNGAGVQVGTGVDVDSVTSARDQFLDAAYRTQNAFASSASTTQTYLNQVQAALNEPSGNGISSQLSKFWSDWSSLANNPTALAAQQAVISDGQALAGSFSELNQQIGSIQSNAASQFNALTADNGQVMSDANQVASLNVAIQQAQSAGENPNTLEDQRGELIDQLSAMANISVTNGTDSGDSSMLSITLGGVTLVNAQDVGTGSPAVNSTWAQSIVGSTPDQVGGTIGALMNVAGSAIAGGLPGQLDGYLTQLDGVAAQLANEVNNPTVGAGTAGAYSASANPPFFTGDSATTLAVDVTAGNVDTTDTGIAGDNDIALATADNSGGTADQAYDSFVSQIGSDAQAAGTASSAQQALATVVSNQRQSVEGVDLNQEETAIIQDQQSYQACAQIMNTFNTMIGTLLQVVGG